MKFYVKTKETANKGLVINPGPSQEELSKKYADVIKMVSSVFMFKPDTVTIDNDYSSYERPNLKVKLGWRNKKVTNSIKAKNLKALYEVKPDGLAFSSIVMVDNYFTVNFS